MAAEGSRGTVGIVRPTQRTGGFEDLLRILPQGIRLIPLALDVQRGALDEFQAAIPAYEAKVAEFARMGVDVINPSGAPPFMVLGYAKRAGADPPLGGAIQHARVHLRHQQHRRHARAEGEAHPRRHLFPRRHQQDLRPVFCRRRLRMPRHGRHRRRFPQGAGAAEQHGLRLHQRCFQPQPHPPRRSTCSGPAWRDPRHHRAAGTGPRRAGVPCGAGAMLGHPASPRHPRAGARIRAPDR